MSKWFSRKLAAFALIVLAYAVNAAIGSPLDADALGSIASVAIAYVLGQSAVDAAGQLGGAKVGATIGEALAAVLGTATDAEPDAETETETEAAAAGG